MAVRIGLAIAVTLALTACRGEGDLTDDTVQTATLTGVVVDVESEGLNEVTSFELRSEGQIYEIFILEEVDYGFPLGHLNEHRVSGDPVEVETEERDGQLYAHAIEDV